MSRVCLLYETFDFFKYKNVIAKTEYWLKEINEKLTYSFLGKTPKQYYIS